MIYPDPTMQVPEPPAGEPPVGTGEDMPEPALPCGHSRDNPDVECDSCIQEYMRVIGTYPRLRGFKAWLWVRMTEWLGFETYVDWQQMVYIREKQSIIAAYKQMLKTIKVKP